MKWIVFTVPCVLLLITLIQNLFFPAHTVRRYIVQVERHGFRRSELKQSAPKAILGICFIAAYPYVACNTLWAALGFVALTIPLFFLFHPRVDEDVKGMFANVTEETIAKAVANRRFHSLWKVALLAAWCVSW